ncbi:MAG: hypothetical protein EHM24_24465 [Acidobacteria bacterium]|jgi:hypothetical protein|nr:MAG: hypothetical protein EHM24_24465 [Acidobacteriota bacterium]
MTAALCHAPAQGCFLSLSAAELRPGDVWEAGDDRIAIDTVTLDHHDELDAAVVRVGGRIISGFGAGRATRRWTLIPTQAMEVVR